MRFLRDPAQRRYYVPVVLCLALTALLLLLPTGYEGAVQYQEAGPGAGGGRLHHRGHRARPLR